MNIFNSINPIRLSIIRRYSSKERFVDISIDNEGIALLSMKRLPVNSLNLDLVQDLNAKIDIVQKNQCKGLVLTSAARVFSAGLDLYELKEPDLSRLRGIWSTVQDIFLKLYASGETTAAAAINGHTAAGGCVVSLFFDYRVMAGDSNAKIGFNDTMVGITPNPWVCGLMNRTMGSRQAELAITASTMFTAEEALKVNLIDEVATNKDDAIEKCKQFIRRYDSIPRDVQTGTKKKLRDNVIKLLKTNREEDLKLFVETILKPSTQKQIGVIMQQMKSIKNKKNSDQAHHIKKML